MKHLLTVSILVFIIISCKRDVSLSNQVNGYLRQVQISLKDSVSPDEFTSLDFSRAIQSRRNKDTSYLRIPFKGKLLQNEFVLLQTNDQGIINRGRIVSLLKGLSLSNDQQYNGEISISSLKGILLTSSHINNGHIQAFHPDGTAQRTVSQENPYIDLPEVIVVGSRHSDNSFSFSDFINLQSLIGISTVESFYVSIDGGGGTGYYGGGNPNTGYTGGSGSNTMNNELDDVYQDPPIEIEPEYIYSTPTVDLKKIFNCFDNVPSVGATYSLTLCADLPSNDNPFVSTNASGFSAGHTFLTVTKANGNSSVTQSFGFYPKAQSSWFDPFSAVPSVIKDNGTREINASIEMNISENQFAIVKQNALNLSSKNYALDVFNCTDYAVSIFNSVRTNPLTMSPYTITLPGGSNPWNPVADPNTISINKSPQMLFTQLQEMKSGNSTEAAHIKIDQSHSSHAPSSKGECN